MEISWRSRDVQILDLVISRDNRIPILLLISMMLPKSYTEIVKIFALVDRIAAILIHGIVLVGGLANTRRMATTRIVAVHFTDAESARRTNLFCL